MEPAHNIEAFSSASAGEDLDVSVSNSAEKCESSEAMNSEDRTDLILEGKFESPLIEPSLYDDVHSGVNPNGVASWAQPPVQLDHRGIQ